MYEAFYNLNAKPFRLSPDPQFFYPSAGHKRALSYLLYGLNQAEGFVVITGAPGTGKTTLSHKLLSQIDAQSVVVAHLASTQIEAEDLLRLVASSFKLRSEHVSKAALLKDIESFLLGRARERKRCLLVVDEAQNLPARSIEELRMLSNFQIGNKALMQVFLLGQEQFRVMLDSPQFEQLRQRVIADYHLQPLDAEETRRYIEARLQHVGWLNDPQFDAGAYAKIFEYTGGLPRRINMFCDRLLLFGYLEGLHTLTHATVCSVIAELHNEFSPRSSNVVFTPAEHTTEQVPETEAPTPSPVVAVRTPPPDIAPPAKITAIPTARGVPERAISPTSTHAPVSLATRRPAKLPEPTPEKLAPAPAARSTSAAAAVREVPDSSIADFLLTPAAPRKGSVPGISNLQSLNTLDEPARELSSSSPSLSGTESRWLVMIIGTVLVLLILGFWIYHSMQNASRNAPAPQAETTPFTKGSTEASVDAKREVTDPSENILTEHRILTAPLPIAAHDTIAANEAPRETNESPVIPIAESKSPTAVAAIIKPATLASTPPVKSTEAEPRPALNKPAGAAATHRAESPPPSVAKSAVKPTLPVQQLPATTVTPVAPLEDDAAANEISQRELALLVMKFARYYEEGNLPSFLNLFDEQVRTEDSNSIEAIRNDYAELFKKTALRQIVLGDIHWENTGRLAQGTGPFEVRINAAEREPPRSLKGDITFHLERKKDRVVIIALYHTLH